MTTQTKLLAFNGDGALKDELLKWVRWHEEQDRLIKGSYHQNGNGFRGCAVGCTLESYRLAKDPKQIVVSYGDHTKYEEFGIPRGLARLEDTLFEDLPMKRARQWPAQFLGAIPVGADLSIVFARFILWTVADPTDGIVALTKHDKTKQLAQEMGGLLTRIVEAGDWDVVSAQEWRSLSDLAHLADLADLAHLAYHDNLADLAYRDYLAHRAYRAYHDNLADLAYRDYLAHRAYRAYHDNLADLAGLAEKCADKLLELLASAPVGQAREVTA